MSDQSATPKCDIEILDPATDEDGFCVARHFRINGQEVYLPKGFVVEAEVGDRTPLTVKMTVLATSLSVSRKPFAAVLPSRTSMMSDAAFARVLAEYADNSSARMLARFKHLVNAHLPAYEKGMAPNTLVLIDALRGKMPASVPDYWALIDRAIEKLTATDADPSSKEVSGA